MTTDEIIQMKADMLKNTDWTQLPDSPLDDATKAKWATYRQAVRDIDQSDPSSITWPTAPYADPAT